MTSFLKKYQFPLLTGNILLIYIVGIIGIISSDNESERLSFMLLTPLNLLMNCAMLLSFHKNWNPKFIASMLFIAVAGFFVEVIGVKTGLLFGNYTYGNSLGLKVLDVPVLMALNWFMLIYAGATMLSFMNNAFISALIGAAVITALDTLIEPLCSFLHFWFWDGAVPLQNFIAWFLISFVLFYLFRLINGRINNKYGLVIMVTQFSFFGIINLYKHFMLS